MTLRNWIAEENDTLQNFVDDYENTDPIKLEALGARIATMHPECNTPDDFDYIENQIAVFNTTHPIDSVSKKFIKIYLDYARDSFVLGASESKFDTIARLCVFYNGTSVLIARDILANNNPELIGYNWGDSLCMTGGSGKTSEFKPIPESKEMPFNDDYRLHPNLLKDKLSARITLKESEHGYVEIYSLQGKKLGIYNITEGTNEIDLSNQLKSGSGIYFYRVWVNGGLKNNDKLIILQ